MKQTITFKKSEILHQVMNNTHIVAEGIFATDKASKYAYSMQADSGDSHASKLVESFSEALSELKRMLAYHIDGVQEDGAQEDEINVSLNLSDRYNLSLLPSLQKQCSAFIINYIISMWFMNRNADLATLYNRLAERAMNNALALFVKLPPTKPQNEKI